MIQHLASIPAQGASAGGPDMTRYVMVCALLLGLICLAAYLFKRFIGTAVRAKAAKRSLQILDVLPLGGKQKVCVVRCYDRTFALGVGDKEVGLIAELDASITAAPAQKNPFSAFLQREETTEGADAAAPRAKKLFPAGGLFG
jgi:flagellar biosynthetic protein FliO